MIVTRVVAARLCGPVRVIVGDGVCDRTMRLVKVSRERGPRPAYLVDVGFGVALRDRLKHPTQPAHALASRLGEQ
jgi:hypothetical protein